MGLLSRGVGDLRGPVGGTVCVQPGGEGPASRAHRRGGNMWHPVAMGTYLHLLLDVVTQQPVGLDALGQGQHHRVQGAPLCHLLMGFLISTFFTF